MNALSNQDFPVRGRAASTPPKMGSTTTSPAADHPAEPKDCVTLGAETYQRRSTREIYETLQAMKDPRRPRPEPSDAQKQKALLDMQKQMLDSYLCRDLGSH